MYVSGCVHFQVELVTNSLCFRFRPQKIIPNSDTFSYCRFIFYNFILKECIMVIPQFLHSNISKVQNINHKRTGRTHFFPYECVGQSWKYQKKMHFVKCWNNIWTLWETKNTTQSKVNAPFLCIMRVVISVQKTPILMVIFS